MSKASRNVRKLLERLRSHEPASALASELGLRESEVRLARDLLRHIGEHQAPAAGRLPDALAHAVVEAAVQIEHSGFLVAVAQTGSRAAASAAKRGLAILRSRGIEVELAPEGAPVFKPEVAADTLPCYLSIPDAHGERILLVSRPTRGGRAQVLSVIIAGDGRIEHLESREVSRKAVRQIAAGGLPSGDPPILLYPVPRERALDLLAAARSRSSGLSIEHEAVLSNLGGDPRQAASPLGDEPALAPELEERRLSESGGLLREPEVAPWRADPDALSALQLRLQEVAASRLYLDEDQRLSQIARELDRAAEAYFAGERAEQWAERLFGLAEGLRARGRQESAERACAAARALRSGTPAARVPFCRALFEQSFPEAARVAAERSAPPPLEIPR